MMAYYVYGAVLGLFCGLLLGYAIGLMRGFMLAIRENKGLWRLGL